jgi:hypothetical protein
VESPAQQADDIQKAQSRIRSLEGKLKRRLPDDFVVKLNELVDDYSPEGKGDISFFVAPTQADPCLAKMIVDGAADAIISDDSDFPMYIGPSGIDIMIKDVMISSKGNPITSVRLSTGQARIANLIEEMLAPKLLLKRTTRMHRNESMVRGMAILLHTLSLAVLKILWSGLFRLLLLVVMRAPAAFQIKVRLLRIDF